MLDFYKVGSRTGDGPQRATGTWAEVEIVRIDLHFLVSAQGMWADITAIELRPRLPPLGKQKAVELRSAAWRDPKNSQNSKLLMTLPHTRLAHYFDFFLVPFFFFVAMTLFLGLCSLAGLTSDSVSLALPLPSITMT